MSSKGKSKTKPVFRDNNGITEKFCNICKEFKALTSGFYTTGVPGFYSSKCRICKNKDRRTWFLSNETENKQKLSEWGKEYRLRPEISSKIKLKNAEWKKYNHDWLKNSYYTKKYNITKIDYDNMVIERENKCQICGILGSDTAMGKLVVDHCHETNYVRGLLCSNCNLGIGSLKENIDNFYKSIEYISDFKQSLLEKEEYESSILNQDTNPK